MYVGPAVPIPTFPLLFTTKCVAVDEPIAKVSTPAVASIESCAHGLVVPIPTFLLESTTSPVPPTVRSEEKRFVDEAVVEKKLVVVALVPVALTKVKFCKVVEPTTRRSPEELMVLVAEPPILSWLAVSCPEKREVEVALVVVDWFAMKPPVKVEEAVERKPCRNPKVVEVELP